MQFMLVLSSLVHFSTSDLYSFAKHAYTSRKTAILARNPVQLAISVYFISHFSVATSGRLLS